MDVSPAELMEEVKGIMNNVNDIISLKNVIAGDNGEQRLVSILDNVNRVVDQMNQALTGNSPKFDRSSLMSLKSQKKPNGLREFEKG